MGLWAWAPQAKEERLAEEKARKKAAAKKMEEVEARRKQEEEARRLKWMQQVRTPSAATGERQGSPRGPRTAGHAPLHQVDPGGSCRLELGRRFNRGHGDGDGDGDLPGVFCRGSSLRAKSMDSGARPPVSVQPSISCVTLGGFLDFSVLQVLQVTVVST